MPVADAQWLIEGLQEMMDAVFLDNATPEDKEVFLFSNDATIADSNTNTDFTEITGNGLDKITLTKVNFSPATEADPIVSVYNSGTGIVWAPGGSRTTEAQIYGWVLRGVTSGKLYGARNWGLKTVQPDEPVVINPVELKMNIPEAS